jgi:hypothetical protein
LIRLLIGQQHVFHIDKALAEAVLRLMLPKSFLTSICHLLGAILSRLKSTCVHLGFMPLSLMPKGQGFSSFALGRVGPRWVWEQLIDTTEFMLSSIAPTQ